ncbi:MAG: DUF192 domain-containing protein [Pseudomonadota bacterium]
MGILHRLTAIRALTWALLFCVLATAHASAFCAPGRVEIRGDWGQARFAVELAVTDEDQRRGLMFRESLPRMSGMLFVYGRQQPLAFWMRNTLIPLDMIFIDATGTVVNVHANAVPLDETPVRSAAPALAVLEINGGLSAVLGIGAGDQIRSPAMPQDRAAWTCE